MTMQNLLLAASNPLDHVVQHPFLGIDWGLPFVFSNHMFMLLVAGLFMLLVLLVVGKQQSIVPTGLKNFFESICVFLRDDLTRPILGDATDRFIPFIWNMFFFILFINVIGMIPIDSFFFGKLHHVGGTSTANIWVTGALASMAFVMIHVNGIREQGLGAYFKNFIPHVPWPLVPVMYVLETIGMFIKPFALAIRLFANMMAGHTVLAALVAMGIASGSYMVGGATIVGCAVFSILELFVAFLQAYIFTFLMTMFIGAAMHPDH